MWGNGNPAHCCGNVRWSVTMANSMKVPQKMNRITK